MSSMPGLFRYDVMGGKVDNKWRKHIKTCTFLCSYMYVYKLHKNMHAFMFKNYMKAQKHVCFAFMYFLHLHAYIVCPHRRKGPIYKKDPLICAVSIQGIAAAMTQK